MASLSYQLMTTYDDLNRKALKDNAYDVAFAWSTCESSVNNIHHGRDPREWIPQLKRMLTELADSAETEAEKAVYTEAQDYADIALSELS